MFYSPGHYSHGAILTNIIKLNSYTESLFAFLSFSGMLLAFRKRYYLAALIFALATCVRANGILHAGFFIWYRIIEPSKKKVGPKADN